MFQIKESEKIQTHEPFPLHRPTSRALDFYAVKGLFEYVPWSQFCITFCLFCFHIQRMTKFVCQIGIF